MTVLDDLMVRHAAVREDRRRSELRAVVVRERDRATAARLRLVGIETEVAEREVEIVLMEARCAVLREMLAPHPADALGSVPDHGDDAAMRALAERTYQEDLEVAIQGAKTVCGQAFLALRQLVPDHPLLTPDGDRYEDGRDRLPIWRTYDDAHEAKAVEHGVPNGTAPDRR